MQTSIKFPIGARVKHSYAGPATVIGHPFTGATGDVNLPVKFDDPDYDSSSGWFETFFTLIEPRKAVDGDIYPPGYFRGNYTVHTPFWYSGSTDGFGEWSRVNLMTRARDQHAENFQTYWKKALKLQRELDDAKAEISSLRSANKIYQEQNARKRAQIASLIETLDTVRKAVQ